MSPVSRTIPGLVPGRVEMDSHKIPGNCSCTWICYRVATSRGPARSYLKALNALCAQMSVHRREMAEAKAAALEYWSAS